MKAIAYISIFLVCLGSAYAEDYNFTGYGVYSCTGMTHEENVYQGRTFPFYEKDWSTYGSLNLVNGKIRSKFQFNGSYPLSKVKGYFYGFWLESNPNMEFYFTNPVPGMVANVKWECKKDGYLKGCSVLFRRFDSEMKIRVINSSEILLTGEFKATVSRKPSNALKKYEKEITTELKCIKN